MRLLRIGLAQINSTVGDLDGNIAKIVDAIARARALGVDLLAFPEMCVPGYPPEDLLLKPAFIQGCIDRTRSLAEHTRGMTVVVGTLERDADLYNSAAVLHDGRFVGTARKRYLPNYGVFDENRYFMAERHSLVFARDGVVFGVNVCEDIWLSGGPSEEQVVRGGAEIILNLSASPYHAGKAEDRRRMISTRAADTLAIVCYVNLVGGQDEIVFDGSSLICDQHGEVLAEGAAFAEDLVVTDVDLDEVFNARLHDPRLRKERSLDESEPMPRVHLTDPGRDAAGSGAGVGVGVMTKPALAARAERVETTEEAEVYAALTLGVRDYVRKNGFENVVLGLSGGIDSALTACLAVDALGAEHVMGVAMPSPYTSRESQDTAEQLARTLGIQIQTVPIGELMKSYDTALAPSFAGRAPDTTEENLQARIRGNTLMALSNKFGWLVLTTGNKSETSVGYSTLYGDTAGGFAVLKDVYKTQVYALSRWRNAQSPAIPERTITRAPSAELKPGQTDQDSLPPYDVLDAILREYVEEDRSPAEIARMGHDEALVRKVARMVDLAEYKRRQSPPGIKITPRAFGKDRRLPITNRWRG
ncbi:MAG: NAD+ synthase [Candidatus Eisenbacteria bacterium]